MNQVFALTEPPPQNRAIIVDVPHTWDGIGQALRSAYRDHHQPPCELTNILCELNDID